MLQLGAVAGAGSLLGGMVSVARPAPAAAATSTVASRWLRRKTYAPLVGHDLRVGGTLLRLISVDDVAGAASDKRLRDNPETFVLTLRGPAGAIQSGPQVVSTNALGRTTLFVSPVGEAAGGRQRYEIVVDRSRRPRTRRPVRPHPRAPERPGNAAAAAAALQAFESGLEEQGRDTARRLAADPVHQARMRDVARRAARVAPRSR